jgi:hypothetical protein
LWGKNINQAGKVAPKRIKGAIPIFSQATFQFGKQFLN